MSAVHSHCKLLKKITFIDSSDSRLFVRAENLAAVLQQLHQANRKSFLNTITLLIVRWHVAACSVNRVMSEAVLQ